MKKAKTHQHAFAVNLICRALSVAEPTPEHKFCPTRKWRLDFAWIPARLALEIEGGVWTGGRHSRGKGMENDMEKYNAAAALGWRVLRVTPGMLEDGRALKFIEAMLARKS